MEQELPVIIQKYIKDVASKYSKKPIQLKPKSSSKLMKAIGWFFGITKISPRFMTDYYTTIGNTIYYPDDALDTTDPIDFLKIISHECIHIKDSNRFGNMLFTIMYLGPLLLTSLSLLAFVAIFASKLWLLWLLALLFLAPIPSYGRYHFEKRAYRVLFVFEKNLYGTTDFGFLRDFIKEEMITSHYYYTWPFPKWIDNDLKDMKFMDETDYKEIADFIKSNL